MRLLCAIALLLIFLTAQGAAPCAFFSHHLRLEAPRSGQAIVAMVWADTCRFALDVPAASSGDGIFGAEVAYRYTMGDSVAAAGRLRLRNGNASAISMVLNASLRGAWVDIGAAAADVSVPVLFDPLRPDSVTIHNPANLPILRNTIICDTIPAPMFIEPDSCTAVWRYLDRSNDGRRAFPAAFYRLGERRLTDGRIALVMLQSEESPLWQPGRVKALLSPTEFVGHYDLMWLRADGRPAPPECYADVDQAQGILTLSFPLLDTTFRLARTTRR